jgi:hypothetical protein
MLGDVGRKRRGCRGRNRHRSSTPRWLLLGGLVSMGEVVGERDGTRGGGFDAVDNTADI